MERGTRYTTLDSLRGVCALVVALFHYPVDDYWIRQLPLVEHGYLFVDFFFVLSGFVIASVYDGKLDGKRGVFILRRFGRLWPLHVATLAVFVLAAIGKREVGADERHSIDAIFTNLFMVQGLGMHSDLTWNGPSWSISVEWALYLVFAALSFIAWRVRVYIALVAIGTTFLIFVAPHGQASTFDFGIFRGLAGFFSGALVARIKTKGRFNTLAEALVSVLVAVFVTIGQLAFLAPTIFALAVYVFSRSDGSISRWLHAKPLQYLGEWSYSIYLVHSIVIAAMLALNMFDPWSAPIVFLAATIACSSLSYRFIERPGRDYFNRLAASPKAPAAAAAE